MPEVLVRKTINGNELKGGDRIVGVQSGSLFFRRPNEGTYRQEAIIDKPTEWVTVEVERFEHQPWPALDPQYFATKFPDEIQERLYYEYCLEHSNYEIGDAEFTGWFRYDEWEPEDFYGINVYLDDIERLWGLDKFPVASIVEVDSQGFVTFDFFDDRTWAYHNWTELCENVESMYDDEGEYCGD